MEEDILNYLPTVMFRGTPCSTPHTTTNKKKSFLLIKRWFKGVPCGSEMHKGHLILMLTH